MKFFINKKEEESEDFYVTLDRMVMANVELEFEIILEQLGEEFRIGRIMHFAPYELYKLLPEEIQKTIFYEVYENELNNAYVILEEYRTVVIPVDNEVYTFEIRDNIIK